MTTSEQDTQLSVALHEADFVHGDVKPANAIIRPDGRACLVDLDVVRRGSVTGERRALTPAFASPEALVPVRRQGPLQQRAPGNLTGEFPEIQVVLPPAD